MTPQQLLFSVIRNEIFRDGTDVDLGEALSNDNLTEFFVLAAKHRLIHVVAAAAIKQNVPFKDSARDRLQKELMSAAYADWQREYALTETCAILRRAGIPHIPLKGAVACHYYPECWMRNSCDIDVLIPPSDAQAAISALVEGGFTREKDTAEHEYAFSAKGGFHLELHHLLTTHGALTKTDALLDTVWEYTVPTEEGGYTFEMAGEFFLFYHVAHMAKHFIRGGCGIRPFIDLHLLKQRMPHDESKLLALLKESELLSFYNAALRLCSVWFEGAPADELSEQMADYILSGGVYGSMQNTAAVKASAGTCRLRSFLGVVFLSRKNLEILYPRLKGRGWLLPFYQVKRWFRVFQRKKRKKLSRFISAHATVSKETVSSTKTMLQALALHEAD